MTAATFTAPGEPLAAGRAPDKVLIIGATGHIGRLFLEQGLELFGDAVEFRVLVRPSSPPRDFAPQVKRVEADIRDRESLRRATEGFGPDSLIFDSSTYIDLSYEDETGAILATNLEGPRHVLAVARECGATLHKCHSQAGLAAPRSGEITERTPHDPSQEEDVYARVPYLVAKKTVTTEYRAAMAEGLPILLTYLVTPLGPFSREDALMRNVLETGFKIGRYFAPRGVGVAFVDARDAAKAHWVAYMNDVQDDLILASWATQHDFVAHLNAATGATLKVSELRYRVMLAIGDAMDLLKRTIMKKTEFPLSNAIVKLMFANNRYSPAKARDVLGFVPREARETVGDHLQDLANRGLMEVSMPPRPVSIW